MTQQVINIGSSANDGTGDPMRTAFQKINANFSEIYSRDAVGSNLDITGNEISAVNTDGDVQISPNGTGNFVCNNESIIIAETNTPTTSHGAAGDLKGMISWDASYVYVCTADYTNGGAVIWKRTAISTW
jgi:hypothetical protein